MAEGETLPLLKGEKRVIERKETKGRATHSWMDVESCLQDLRQLVGRCELQITRARPLLLVASYMAFLKPTPLTTCDFSQWTFDIPFIPDLQVSQLHFGFTHRIYEGHDAWPPRLSLKLQWKPP